MLSAIIAGDFRACVAKKVGDDTADSVGFLTLNPLMHIDAIGALLLVFYGFGWGRHVPVNPYNIVGGWRKTKIFLATFADVFAYIVTAIIAMVALFVLFGPSALIINHPFMVRAMDLVHFPISALFPEKSSITIIVGLILMGVMILNTMLSAIHIIINGTDTAFLLMAEDSSESYVLLSHLHYYRVMITSLILLFLFSGYLRLLVGEIIVRVSVVIAYLIGSL
jgi:hypothetical protein